MRVGAVDCGTNSVRLLVADVDADGAGKRDVRREMRIVRLGQDVDRTGELAPEALERTRAALQEYAGLCAELAVERVRMVATSATRDARNRDEFLALVQDTLGVLPEVVSGAQEAALSFAGATRELPAREGPFLVVDIGGGSTEFVLGTGTVQAAHSVDIGCVRLTERHLRDDPPTSAQLAAARADIQAALDAVAVEVPLAQAGQVIGLAGSVTTVAALALGLTGYDSERVHGSTLSGADARRLAGELLAMTRVQRAALPVMHPGRVDVIGAGALILAVVVERLDLSALRVSEHDILDGIAWSVPGATGAR